MSMLTARWWRSLSQAYPVVFLRIPDLDISFVRYTTEFEFVLRRPKVWRKNILPDSNIVDFCQCCYPRPFSLLCLIQEVDT